MRKCNIAGASWQHPKAGAPEDTEHRTPVPGPDRAREQSGSGENWCVVGPGELGFFGEPGVITLRVAGRLHHIGVSRTYTGIRVLILIQDLDV